LIFCRTTWRRHRRIPRSVDARELNGTNDLGIPLVIIAGSNEYDRGVVQIKDLVTVGELAETATLEEWKANEAQQEVALAEVVVTTCRLLSSAL